MLETAAAACVDDKCVIVIRQFAENFETLFDDLRRVGNVERNIAQGAVGALNRRDHRERYQRRSGAARALVWQQCIGGEGAGEHDSLQAAE